LQAASGPGAMELVQARLPKYWEAIWNELRKMAEDESQFGITHFLLKQMMNASKGSGAAFDRLFDRIVGKVQDDVKITAGVDIKVSSDQLASMAQAALKRTKGGNE